MVGKQLAGAFTYLIRTISFAALIVLPALEARADASDEIKEFMTTYRDAFDTGHNREIAAFYDAPFYMLAPNGDLRSYDTQKDVRQTVKKWRRYLAHYGFERTEWVTLNVKALSDGTGLVSSVLDRFNSKGERFHRGGATYTVHKRDGAWKIFLIHIHDPEAAIAFE